MTDADRKAFEEWMKTRNGHPFANQFTNLMWAAWQAALAYAAKLRAEEKPVGYLPAYELDRVRSGHSGQLRSARFGPSELDGDVAVVLRDKEAT